MKTLREIVSIYKIEEGIFTDEAAANSLGCTKNAFSNYMRGERRMPDMAIMKLARSTSIPVDEILTAVNLNLKAIADNEHELSYWLDRATDYAAVIATTTILILGTGFPAKNANATNDLATLHSEAKNIHRSKYVAHAEQHDELLPLCRPQRLNPR